MTGVQTCALPICPGVTVATFADDTAVLASSANCAKASQTLQDGLTKIQEWLKRWRIKPSASKSVHTTFSLRREDCPPVTICGQQLPHNNPVKYLGMHLDRKLTWRNHIQAKRDELNMKYRGLYWLLGRNSKLSLDNKILIYKTILKPAWTYDIQLWGSACISNISILQRAEYSILKEVHHHLQMNIVKDDIQSYAKKYKKRLLHHPNQLAVQRTVPDTLRRLKRRKIMELASLY